MLRISPTDKVLMILLSNTVSHPGTVVVKPRDTPCERENQLYYWAQQMQMNQSLHFRAQPVADTAVLASDGPPHKARAEERI